MQVSKRIQFAEGGQIYIVVSETESTVTYRKHFSKSQRNFTTVNKKYVNFI